MFVTVQFGEGQTELFNLNCRVIDFIHNLKERCYLDSQDCVDLMDRTGELVNLSEKEKSMEQASSMMKERHSYVLIRICKVLKKLSNPCKEQDKKGGPSRKGSVNQIRRKPTAGNKKSHPGRLKDMKKGEEEG
eukprot:XP_014015900.1 PREDICTED: uncharacterized protein C22orf15-like isoform X2 [Salmo salar]